MGTAWVECWKCDECGHRWIKGDTWPSHCASSKCRKRTWNKLGAGLGSTTVARGNTVLDRDNKQEGLKPRLPSTTPPRMNDAMATFLSGLRGKESPDTVESRTMCGYREYDQESGETMGCGLPEHSVKQKHGAWKRL
jgi:hypothetical protein